MKFYKNYVYAFQFARVTKVVSIVKRPIDWYKVKEINDFLHLFAIGDSYGSYHLGKNDDYGEFWFDCYGEFFEILHTESMERAFKRMGVELVFEYPFMEESV